MFKIIFICLAMTILVGCERAKNMQNKHEYDRLTIQLANTTIDKKIIATFCAVVERKSDGFLKDSFFIYPISKIKYPRYLLEKLNTSNIEKYKILSDKKEINESIFVRLSAKMKPFSAEWSMNPETDPWGIVYDYSIMDMYVAHTPNWQPYKLPETEQK